MNKLKVKAALETAGFIGTALFGALVVNLLIMYGHLLPFTLADFGLALSVLSLVCMIVFAYKMRLEELERRDRLSKNSVL